MNNLKEYNILQIKEIRRYARLLHTDENTASINWVTRGLAKKFAIKHRAEFGLPVEK